MFCRKLWLLFFFVTVQRRAATVRERCFNLLRALTAPLPYGRGSERLLFFRFAAIALIFYGFAVTRFDIQATEDKWNEDTIKTERKAVVVPGKNCDPDEIEKAIMRALDFLENAQQIEGFWQNKNRVERESHTGWALLAFLANGHTARNGQYRQTVEKGLAWYFQQVKALPDEMKPRYFGKERMPSYERHAFALFVLLTAIGNGTQKIQDEDLIIYCERGIEKTLQAQYKKEEGASGVNLLQDFAAGGWGPVDESAWFTLCLLSARQIGIKIPKIALENTREFWMRHYQPQFGSFYQ